MLHPNPTDSRAPTVASRQAEAHDPNACHSPSAARKKSPLLFVVEGIHDIHFLRRISRTLHLDDPALPDLAACEEEGRLVFLPFGGGDVWEWTNRLAPIGLRELHLYDAETGVETSVRLRAAAFVNARPGCRAFLTEKRNVENYLSPEAIFEARGVSIEFTDQDNVAELVARHCYEQAPDGTTWESLPGRARKRLRERAKHWLNTAAAERMTPERLRNADRPGNIIAWLRAAAELGELL